MVPFDILLYAFAKISIYYSLNKASKSALDYHA